MVMVIVLLHIVAYKLNAWRIKLKTKHETVYAINGYTI